MKIKILVGLSILCFFIIATSVVAGYIVVRERNNGTNLESTSKFGQLTEKESTNSASPSTGITTAEVAIHQTPSDCWITISGKIYDVTSFLNIHPGGSLVMTPYCGKDATDGFNTKDKNPAQNHTKLALDMLSQYFIANVGEKITTNQISQLSNSKVAIPTTKPIVVVNPPTTQPLQTSTTTLSTAEVASHNTTSNCWLIISNNVYNVTSYLVQHPGGVSIIAGYCGKEATGAFQTRGGKGGNHSNTAYGQLNNYLISSIGSTITTTTNGGATSGSTGTTVNPTNQPINQSVNLPASVSAKYPGATIKKQEDDGEEMEIITTQGNCRHIKLNNDGSIRSDQSC